MGARLAHPEGLPNTPLLDEVVDALLDSHVRASHTATRPRDTFLAAAPRITAIRSDGSRSEAEFSPHHFPSSTKQSSSVHRAESRFWRGGAITCTPSKLGGPTSMLVGGKETFSGHSRDLANKCQLLGLK